MARHVKIVNEKRGWCAIEVARCGCTTLKGLAYEDKHGEPFPYHINKIHAVLGYSADDSEGIVVDWSHSTEGLFHFAVWRPPMERSFSTWRRFTQYGVPNKFYEQVNKCSFDHWTRFVTEQLIMLRDNVDIHLRRQSDFYDEADVAAIVPLHKLGQFMAEKFGHENVGKANAGHSGRPLEQPVSYYAVAELAKLYAPDFCIQLSKKFISEI